MQEFIFTSDKFKGSMKFGYTNGILSYFENNAILDDAQLIFLECNFPFKLQYLNNIKGQTGKIEEVTDLSFEAFWDQYGYKVDKIQAENYYNKMPDADKLAAICGIKRYKYNCKFRSSAMIYPIRYLRNRRWEDEQ